MIDAATVPLCDIDWRGAVRIVRSVFAPIYLFEDIADPADWPLLISAEQKTNPRLMETIGNIDLIPPRRRVGGPGSSYLMAPFTHVSADRPSRFARRGGFGVLYAAKEFETAFAETIHHHGRFMARTKERPGWTSQFREIILDIAGRLHDLRGDAVAQNGILDPDDHAAGQAVGERLQAAGANGVVYPSVRRTGGECTGLFYPDLASHPRQGRHLDYHWDGARVDLYRDATSGAVYRIV